MSKRKHARVVAQQRVEYQHVRGQSDEMLWAGCLMDLSVQGCRIKGTAPFSCGSRVGLQLWLPDQAQPVNVEQAVVRWVKDDQFGVSFQAVPPDTLARLEHVFQLLHEAQFPNVKMIHVSASLLP